MSASSIPELNNSGYSVIPRFYSDKDVSAALDQLRSLASAENTPIHAVRDVFQHIPELKNTLISAKLIELVTAHIGNDFSLVKAIYFDKPENSNWFVSWHQDIVVQVDQKIETPGFVNWSFKNGNHFVQPPVPILENILTVRIHLDDTDETNGALKVIPGSHVRGIVRTDQIDPESEEQSIVRVAKGGIMLMKPLLFHSSSRSSEGSRRRVIHLEFSPDKVSPMNWK